jgi:hypothetical protein
MTDTSSRYRIDLAGGLWIRHPDGTWADPWLPADSFAADELETHHGPTVELVPATRVAELKAQLADAVARAERAEQDAHAARADQVAEAGRAAELRDTLAKCIGAPTAISVHCPCRGTDYGDSDWSDWA